MNIKRLGHPYDGVPLISDKRHKHYKANEYRIILKTAYHWGSTRDKLMSSETTKRWHQGYLWPKCKGAYTENIASIHESQKKLTDGVSNNQRWHTTDELNFVSNVSGSNDSTTYLLSHWCKKHGKKSLDTKVPCMKIWLQNYPNLVTKTLLQQWTPSSDTCSSPQQQSKILKRLTCSYLTLRPSKLTVDNDRFQQSIDFCIRIDGKITRYSRNHPRKWHNETFTNNLFASKTHILI